MGVEVAVGAIAALITFVFGVLGTYVTTRRNLDLQYDAELRRDRLDAYKALWKEFKPLQKYAQTSVMRVRTRHYVGKLSGKLKDWYFDTVGVFLSYEARRDYFAVQEALDGIRDEELSDSVHEELSDAEYDLLRVRASRLRTTLTRDVGTRKTFKFRGDLPALNVKKVRGLYVNDETEQSLELSFRRFIRPWRGLRKLGRRWPRLEMRERPEADATELRIEDWDSDRRAITVRVREDAPVRLLHIEEDGELIEGPKSWPSEKDTPSGEDPKAKRTPDPKAKRTPDPPVVWRKSTGPR